MGVSVWVQWVQLNPQNQEKSENKLAKNQKINLFVNNSAPSSLR